MEISSQVKGCDVWVKKAFAYEGIAFQLPFSLYRFKE